MKNTVGLLIVGALLAAGCSKHSYSLPATSQDFGQTVTYNNKVDVVMMIDNSSSMDLYQNKLANEVPAMVANLNSLGMDYRIVVVTSDMRTGGNGGVFVGSPKVLSKGNPSLVSLLTSRIKNGSGGSDLERGIESIRSVLSPSYLAGEGAGFLREDALLAIIALSNEDDYSSGSTQSFADFLETVKPPFTNYTKAWVVNFIGVPSMDSMCSSGLDYKEPGLRWMDLATKSQGRVESICNSSLSFAVENVKKRIIEIITDFKLGRKPVLETIKVYLNGSLIPQSTVNGWEYIEDGFLIRFHGTAVPGADVRIKVDFTPAEAQ